MKIKSMSYEILDLLHHEIHNNRPKGANHCCVVKTGAETAFVRFYRVNSDGSVDFWTGESWRRTDRKEVPSYWPHLPPETKTKESTDMADLKQTTEGQDPTLKSYVKVNFSYDWEWVDLLVRGERLYAPNGETFYYFDNGRTYEKPKKDHPIERHLTYFGPTPELYRVKKVKVENLPCRSYAVWNPAEHNLEGKLSTYEDVIYMEDLAGVSLSEVITCPDIEQVVGLMSSICNINLSYQELYQD